MFLQTTTYRADIDGLRAIAVLGVIAYHFFGVRGGFTGVDIFFVISGFLITQILLTETEQKSFNLIKFYDRRIKRLLPSLIAVLITSLLVGYVGLLSSEYKNLGWHTLWASIFSSNIALWAESGYFDKVAETKPLLHLWSLGIEAQFYLIWPPILFALIRLKYFWPPLLFLFFSSLGINLWLVQIDAVTSFYLIFSRAWEFLLGAAVAKLHFSHASFREKLPNYFSNITSLIGLLLILFSFIKITSQQPYPSHWALLPTVGVALIILQKNNFVSKKILESRVLIYIGLISYPLYLWHWPTLTFARIMSNGELTTSIKIASLFLSFLLAIISYHWVEKYLRHRKSPMTSPLMLAIAVCIGFTGFYIHNQKGLSDRFPSHETQANLLEPTHDAIKLSIYHNLCEKISHLPNSSYIHCRIAKSNSPPTVAIIGDSHAGQNYSGLAEEFNKLSENVILLYRGACAPLVNTQVSKKGENNLCIESFAQVFQFIEATPTIKKVILSFRAPWYLYGGGKTFTQKYKNPYIVTPSIEVGIKNTYHYLNQIDREMILMIDNPELDFFPHECLDIRPIKLGSKTRDICGVTREYAEKIINPYFHIVQNVKNEIPDIKIFNAFKYFCDAQYCYGKIDGKMMYADGNHLNGEGSMYIAKKFILEQKSNFKIGLSSIP